MIKTPKSRTQEYITYSSGDKKIRCYGKHNPHYYMDSENNLNPIDITYVMSSSSNVGDILLRDKNVVSVGVRQDNSTEKYIGLRPDKNQSTGDEQLEFSIIDIDFDGNNITPILNLNNKVNDNTLELGNIYVSSNRNSTTQMVKVDTAPSNFMVKYKLHLKGLNIRNPQINYSDEVLRKPFSMNLVDYNDNGKVTAERLNTLLSTAVPNDSHVVDIHVGYIDESYVSYRKSEFSIRPLKNSIGIFVRKNGVMGGDIYPYINNMVADILGATIYKSYFVRDGKRVGMSALDYDDNYWYVDIHTKPIVDEDMVYLDSVNISNVGYVDVNYSDFLTEFQNRCEITQSQLTLNGQYYTPDNGGNFIIENSAGEFVFKIETPNILDNNFNVVNDGTLHSLKANSDGTFEYCKYSDIGYFLSTKNNIKYIDITIVYSETSDGYINNGGYYFWPDVASGSSGTITSDSTSEYAYIRAMYDYVNSKLSFRNITRGYLYFDTSGVTSGDNITLTLTRSGSLYDYPGISDYHANLITISSSEDLSTLETGDWGGQGGVQTTYNDTEFDTSTITNTDGSTGDITLNSTALSDAKNNNTLQFSVREYDHDYPATGSANSTYQPGTDKSYHFHYYTSDYTGTSNDPYVEISLNVTPPTTFILKSGTLNIKGGNLILNG